MATLPPRPYVVSPKFIRKSYLKALALALCGIAGIVGGGWWTVHYGAQITRDQAIWAHGTNGLAVRVSGRSTSHSFLINDYDLDVTFVDPAGAPHGGQESFSLLFSAIDDGEPVDLKYDAADPTRYVVSWAVDHSAARWGQVLFLGLVFAGLFGVMLLVVAIRKVGEVTLAQRVAERSDEHLLELVSVKPVVLKGKHVSNTYSYRHVVGGQTKTFKQTLPIAEQPLFSDEKATHLVALVSAHAPSRPWIVRRDYLPFFISGVK